MQVNIAGAVAEGEIDAAGRTAVNKGGQFSTNPSAGGEAGVRVDINSVPAGAPEHTLAIPLGPNLKKLGGAGPSLNISTADGQVRKIGVSIGASTPAIKALDKAKVSVSSTPSSTNSCHGDRCNP